MKKEWPWWPMILIFHLSCNPMKGVQPKMCLDISVESTQGNKLILIFLLLLQAVRSFESSTELSPTIEKSISLLEVFVRNETHASIPLSDPHKTTYKPSWAMNYNLQPPGSASPTQTSSGRAQTSFLYFKDDCSACSWLPESCVKGIPNTSV